MSGSSSQPDHSLNIQALHQWIQRNAIQSVDATTGTIQPGRRFVPIPAVEEYLRDGGTYERTKAILKDIFPGPSNNINEKAVAVAENCPRILCILVELGKGNLIDGFVRYVHLHDSCLPFHDPEHPPQHFPVLTRDREWYKQFYRKQWKYFAQELRQLTRAQLLDAWILPFTALELKGNGNDAWVYRAQVHPKYDKLTTSPPGNHCYALKTFKTQASGGRYDREALAFEQVTGSGTYKRDMVGLIAFHSSFEYKGTFNIILEYAEHGNLQEFFEGTAPPTSGDMIINFWESLFDTAKALFSIHHHFLGTDQNGNRADIQGWHHDLKPANILVTTTDGRLKYPYSFKLADLGLSRFQYIMGGQPEASGRAVFGTRTYGAPECYASTEHTMHVRNDVKRSTDIWSLGCVYSESAVWLVKGAKQLQAYKTARNIEARHLDNTFRDGACFHDGQTVLQAVARQHNELRRCFKKGDFITGPVIDNIITDMLLSRPTQRTTADQLVGKVERQIKLAKEEFLRFSLHTPPSAVRVPYATPAQSPGSVSSGVQAHFDNRVSAGSAYANDENVLNETGRVFQSPEQSRANTMYPYPSTMVLPGDLPGPSDLEEITPPPNATAWNSTVPSLGQRNAHQHPRVLPLRLPPLVFQSEGHSATNDTELSNHFRAVSSGSAPQASPPLHPHSLPSKSPQPGMDPGKGGEGTSGIVQAASGADAARSTTRPVEAASESIDSRCTLKQATEWYKKKKYKDSSAHLPNEELKSHLHGRDHVFIVDDSRTMSEHWTDVVERAKLLTYITKREDPDGVDLYFLSSDKRFNIRDSTEMAKKIKKHKPVAQTSLDTAAFDHEIRSYGQKIASWVRWGSQESTQPRKRSIYFLTDGAWEAGESDQGQESIELLVNRLTTAHLTRNQVGIQLISFGEHRVGLPRLQALDFLKQTKGLKLDIVDTEPSEGDVWKMLLGAILPKFDGDSDEALSLG